MAELWQMIIGLTKLLLVCLVGFLYAMGGRDEFPKYIRRFIAPGVLIGGLFLYDINFWYLLSYPLYVLAYCQGYGADDLWTKVRRRAFAAGLIALASLPIAIVNSAYVLFGSQAALCLLGSIVLGTYNPTPASNEELLIGTTSILFVPYYVG